MVKHRKEIGVLIPFLFFQIAWWLLAFEHKFFEDFGKIVISCNRSDPNRIERYVANK